MVVGAFDDRYDISVRFRLFAQTVAFLLVTNVFDAPFHYSLGAIFGGDSIDIGWFGLPFSWLLYLAIINAFNMIDGIDGLLASLAMTAMAGIGIITYQSHADIFALAVVLFGALNAFLISNLFSSRVTVKKSFMGDAGSMVIGFSIAWMLHVITQDSSSANVATFSPVTALFFITVPMFDLVATLLRRLKLGKSPFLSDKNHIHHIMLRAGYSERKTLISLFMASVSSVICGLGMHFTGVSEHVQVTVYLFALSIYILTTVLFDGVAPTVKLKKDA